MNKESIVTSVPHSSFKVQLFTRCGLAWDKAHPWAKRLSWQNQGGRVK
jgi:hypothetical protein